jgi:hypothetical protein
VDFACIERQIVIELDGGQHQEQLEYDEQRTEYLRQHGMQVPRFWNNEVSNNLEGVLTVIAESLKSAPPIPTFPLKGGRSSAHFTESVPIPSTVQGGGSGWG